MPTNAVTWGFATLNWTCLVTKSGIPRQTLLQALMSFDLFGCYLVTLRPILEQLEPECQDTIKRVAFSGHATLISKLVKKLYVPLLNASVWT